MSCNSMWTLFHFVRGVYSYACKHLRWTSAKLQRYIIIKYFLHLHFFVVTQHYQRNSSLPESTWSRDIIFFFKAYEYNLFASIYLDHSTTWQNLNKKISSPQKMSRFFSWKIKGKNTANTYVAFFIKTNKSIVLLGNFNLTIILITQVTCIITFEMSVNEHRPTVSMDFTSMLLNTQKRILSGFVTDITI